MAAKNTPKMKLKLLVFSLFFLTELSAQNFPKVATSYNFSQTVGTYSEITGGTVLGNTSSDNQVFIAPSNLLGVGTDLTPGLGFPIGFNFDFNSNTFDRVAVNANGWISFGKSSLGSGAVMGQISVSPISHSAYIAGNVSQHDFKPNEELRNRVSALGFDLVAQSDSEIRLETIGVSPNKTLVVQWKNYKVRGMSGIDLSNNYNFQIRLNETTNIVDVVYGSMTFGPTGYGAQVGLGGYKEDDYHNRWVSSSVSSTNSWAATDSGIGFSASITCDMVSTIPAPVSGATFRWSPTSLSLSESKFLSLKVYPNSVKDILNITNGNGITSVLVCDLLGKEVLSKTINDNYAALDLSNLSSGIYLVKIKSEGHNKTVKIIKQ